jgi:hypothetical protein
VLRAVIDSDVIVCSCAQDIVPINCLNPTPLTLDLLGAIGSDDASPPRSAGMALDGAHTARSRQAWGCGAIEEQQPDHDADPQ